MQSGRDTASSVPLERRRIRQFARIFTAGLIVLFFALGGGFLVFVDHVASLKQPVQTAVADGIIVLTGGSARMDTGIQLLKDKKAKRLLISGVHPKAGLDDLRNATGADRMMFNCCVDIDRVALNTSGNAKEGAKWAKTNRFDSVIVVTNNYHMPRSLLEIRRLLPGVDIRPYPVVNTPLNDNRWIMNADAFRVLSTEYIKYLAVRLYSFLPLQFLPGNSEPASLALKAQE